MYYVPIILVMYIDVVPNRNSPPAILLRESFWKDGKVRKRTLANLSKLPPHLIDALRRFLKGATPSDIPLHDAFDIVRSLPHGHVAAVLSCLRQCGLESLIASRRSRQRDLVVAMIVARILDPRSKLATARGLSSHTASDSLAEMLDLADADENELYQAMDWLLQRQTAIEARLADKHLQEGALVLYDLSSTWFEGRHCPLARYGYSRDRKRGSLQLVFGLLCDRQGWPLAIEAFQGDTADPSTVAAQVDKMRKRFGLSRVVLVGDRGLLTEARIREDLKPAGLDWISALRGPALRALVEQGALQPSLFDQRDLAEITCPTLYPGERLIVCRNPLLAEERSRKREELLAATETELGTILKATQRERRRLKGEIKIRQRVHKVVDKYKMKKHFLLDITDDRFSYRRNPDRIAAEAALDGFYVVRTSLAKTQLDSQETVKAYKGLSVVERAFRCFKTIDLKVRPIHHRLASRVRAHLLLCLLAYYVERHMRLCLAPMLFDDEEGPERTSVVAAAKPSASARKKAASKHSPDGLPVHSFRTLLADLGTIVKQRVQPSAAGSPPFDLVTRPTPQQEKVLSLLNLRLGRTR